MGSEPINLQQPRSKILLASASPRRQELLRQIGINFQLIEHHVDETHHYGESPREFVLRMALEKAHSGLRQVPVDCLPIVLGADTIVVIESDILGKPRDRQDALAMLKRLSAKEHRVLSAVAVTDQNETRSAISETLVKFAPVTRTQALAYWETGEPADKAGGYAIQGMGGTFVKAIKGSYSGVVGLPVFETAQLLACFGVHCWQRSEQIQENQQ